MAIHLHFDVVFPKKLSKDTRKLLSEKLTSFNFIANLSPQKILEITEDGDINIELIKGLTVECHTVGCFHLDCEDFEEGKLELIGKTLKSIAKLSDMIKEHREVELVLHVTDDRISPKTLNSVIRKGVRADFEKRLKEMYKGNARVSGIRLVIPPDTSQIVDLSGVVVRVGPTKMIFDRFKDENVIIEILKESVGKITKVLEAK